MNFEMWGQALRIIPRLSKPEWDRLDAVSKWLIATRAAVLIMTFISAAIAGIFAFRNGQFHLVPWLLLVIGLVLAHATNNLLNDLTDYRRGVDKDNYFRTQYGAQPLEQGLWTQRDLASLCRRYRAGRACDWRLLRRDARLAGPAAVGAGRAFRAVLHLAAEVCRPGRARRHHRVGSADDRRGVLRHHRALGLERGAGKCTVRTGTDHRHLREAHRQARPGPGEGHPHAAGDHWRAALRAEWRRPCSSCSTPW